MNRTISISILLLALLCFLLTGCEMIPGGNTTGKRPSVPVLEEIELPTQADNTETEATVHYQYLPQSVENPDGLPVLQWLCLETARDDFQEFSQDAAVEINRLLAEKGMPFRLQFVLCSTESSDGTDWFSIPAIQEAMTEADLIYGSFTSDQATQYLMPITKYVEGNAKPSLEQAVPHKAYWLLAEFSGEIYGIPTRSARPHGWGYQVANIILEDFGITEADFACPYWEKDELFARIYALNDNKPFLYDRVGDYEIFVDPITLKLNHINRNSYLQSGDAFFPTSFDFPILTYFQSIVSCYAVDYSTGTPTVVNYLETDYVRKSQAAMLRYRKAGYLTTDYASALISVSMVYSDYIYRNESEKYTTIPAEQVRWSSISYTPSLNGISATSEHSEESLKLLSLVANDEAFRETLLFGIEEKDYTLTEAGSHASIIQKNGSSYNMSFLSAYSDFYGTGSDIHVPTQEGSTRLESYKNSMDRALVKCKITFDFSAVAAEVEAVNAILTRQDRDDFDVDPPIQFAIFGNLTEAEYDQMLAEIKAAGGDKIQAELQRQLDAWLAENPDWNN